MTVTATLVLGADGSTSKNGNSREISTPEDGAAFLARRRNVDFILIGGNTARNEPYQRTPVPVVVVSKSLINPLANNRNAYMWNCTPAEALQRGIEKFGENVHIESGISILQELIAQDLIDTFELSISPVIGGEDQIDYNVLISNFPIRNELKDGDTLFITAKKLK